MGKGYVGPLSNYWGVGLPPGPHLPTPMIVLDPGYYFHFYSLEKNNCHSKIISG